MNDPTLDDIVKDRIERRKRFEQWFLSQGMEPRAAKKMALSAEAMWHGEHRQEQQIRD